MTVRVALQGFRPFGGHTENPSEQIVAALAADPPDGVDLRALVVPVEQRVVRERIPAFFDEVRPHVWLGVGLWEGRPSVSVERFAANLADFRIPDAAGEQPRGELIEPAGPTAWRATVPDEEIVAAWQRAGIPGFASNTAGAYLCNMSLYLASEANRRHGGEAGVGFIHVPLLPSMVRDARTEPSVPLAELVRAVRVAVEASVAAVRSAD